MSPDTKLTHDVARGPHILRTCGIFVALALLTVVLRTYVRLRLTKSFGIDDYLILIAMAVMFAEMMIITPEVRYGAGRHVQYIEPASNVSRGLHLNFVTQPLCSIALCLTKLSVGLFLLSNYGKHGDPLYDSSDLTIWTTIEICIAIIAACAPCLKPFFRKILESTIVGSVCGRIGNSNHESGLRPYDRVVHSNLAHELESRGKPPERETSDNDSQEHILERKDAVYVSKTFLVSD